MVFKKYPMTYSKITSTKINGISFTLQDKKKLLLMATNSQEGKALYQSFITDACRNIVHILEDIPSCKPPLDHLCELLPRLQPRYYSISSSPKVNYWHINLTTLHILLAPFKFIYKKCLNISATSWNCPHNRSCGGVQDIDWSRQQRRGYYVVG